MADAGTLTTRDGVAVLSLGAPEGRFSGPTVAALTAALDRVVDDGTPLVVTGEGKFFSNGLDLEWMGADSDATTAMLHDLGRFMGRLLTLPVPTAAAVNGHAFGAGAMIVLCTDRAVMHAERGYWCLPEVDIGLPFSPGMAALLTARLSPATLAEAATTGRRYTGAEALAAGVVAAVAPADAVVDAAVAALAPLARTVGPNRGAIKRGLWGRAAELLGA